MGYKHYPKDLAKFKPVDKDDDLTNLRFGNNTLIEIGRTDDQFDRGMSTLFSTKKIRSSISFVFNR
ncbi:hypothetical protein [Gilliamella apicola]|uniref:hypothetical protein n=1 Tax=Gilliamella apicola TaxID=1196095 RepID=UPI0015C4F25C|nr:hypothetical protein [Gilliamella apicola]